MQYLFPLLLLQKIKQLSYLIAVFIISLMVSKSWGGIHSTLETGEVVDRIRANVSTQWLINGEYEGIGVMGHLEVPLSESSSWKVGLGKGSDINLQVDGSWKWIPIPDYEGQPAVGLVSGVTYIHCPCPNSSSASAFGLYAHPILSKKIDANFGTFNTYTGPLLGFMFNDNNTWYPIRFTLGSELIIDGMKNLGFILEGSLNLKNSANSVALGIGYIF